MLKGSSMPMLKYLARNWYKPEIQKIEVQKASDVSVWIDGRRFNKRSEGALYCDTFLEAKNFLIQVVKEKVEKARRELARHEKNLNDAENLNEDQ